MHWHSKPVRIKTASHASPAQESGFGPKATLISSQCSTGLSELAGKHSHNFSAGLGHGHRACTPLHTPAEEQGQPGRGTPTRHTAARQAAHRAKPSSGMDSEAGGPRRSGMAGRGRVIRPALAAPTRGQPAVPPHQPPPPPTASTAAPTAAHASHGPPVPRATAPPPQASGGRWRRHFSARGRPASR